MPSKRLVLPSLLLALLVGNAGAQAPPSGTKEVLPMPADVMPNDGRAVVQRRMNRHGAALMELTLAVTLLQRDTVDRVAKEVGNDTGLPAEDGGTATLTAGQRRFRYLEGLLRERTATLAQASHSGDNAALATAFGNMMQVCISCHSLYLHQPEQAAPKP